MSKINENVWGEVPETGGALRVNRSLRDLIAAGLYNPETGNFEMSISPWGIGYSNAGNFSIPWYTRTGEAASESNNRINKMGCEDSKSYNTPFLMGSGIYGLREIYTNEYIKPSQRLYGGTTKDNDNYIISTVKYDLGDKPPSYRISASDSVAKLQPALYLDYQSIKVVATVLHWINLINGTITRTALTNPTQFDSYKSAVNSMDLENIGIIAIEYEIWVKNNGVWGEITSDTGYMIHNFKKFKVTDRLKQFYFSGNESEYVQIMPRNYIGAPYKDAAWSMTGGRSIPMESYSYGRLASYHSFDNSFEWENFAGGASGRFTVGSWSFDDEDYTTDVLSFWGGTNPIREAHENDIIPYSGYIRTCSITKITRTTEASNASAINNLIRHEIAFLGLPFINGWSANYATQNIGDADVYLPVFDDHMLTTGTYVRGAAALELPNALWQNVFDDTMPDYDSEYNPNPGPRPVPDPNPNPIYPSTPSFTLAGKGTTCYALRDGDMDDILAAVFGKEESDWDDLLNGLKFYGADPMAAIISYKWYPFTFNPTPEATVRLGGVEVSSTLYSYFNNVSDTLKRDSFTFWAGLDKNFINSRHTVARLWLPFYGFYSLPIQNFISEELEVEFHYNVPDELGVWIISFGDVIYDFVECNPSIDIPLSAIDYRGQKFAQISSAINYGSSAINGLSGLASGIASMATGGSLGLGGLETMRSENGYGSIGSMLKAQGVAGTMTAFDSDQIGTRSALIQGAGMVGSGVSQSFNSLGGAITGIANNYANTRRTLNQLAINVPLHGAAGTTTFLNLPMAPYVQVFRNIVIDDYNESQYKLKNGHACDKWVTAASMPSNSLCQTSGIADINTSGMELREVQELNSILQNGFFIAIE